MNDLQHVLRRFPNFVSTIRARADKDPAFRAMLADYEEVSTWLASRQNLPTSDPVELESALELIRNLEEEILSQIERQDADASEKYDTR